MGKIPDVSHPRLKETKAILTDGVKPGEVVFDGSESSSSIHQPTHILTTVTSSFPAVFPLMLPRVIIHVWSLILSGLVHFVEICGDPTEKLSQVVEA